MLIFLLGLGTTVVLAGLVTALLGLRTSLVIRLTIAAILLAALRGIPVLFGWETFPGWEDLSHGIALGTFLTMGVSWWKKQLWSAQERFDLHFSARTSFRTQRSISGLTVRLGIISILLGVAVMEVTVSIVYGFQGAIHSKVIGFGGHVRVGNLLEELESKVTPLPRVNDFIPEIAAMEEVDNIAPYVMKPAILKATEPQEGVLLKGLDTTYNWQFFEAALQSGALPDFAQGKRFSKDLFISQKIADVLDVEVGDKVVAYFFLFNNDAVDNGKVKVRSFEVCGIFKTDLGEFDQQYAMCDLRALQGIWGWSEDQVAGFEVRLADIGDVDEIEPIARDMQEYLPYQYEATPITNEYPELFEWVELQHQNVWFILGLMVIVAVINMISVLLILILERTRTIGLLKALGMANGRLWNLFVTNGSFLVLIGMALGNVLGLGLIASQHYWGWLTVDQDSYFVEVVPVEWVWDWFFLINLGVLVVCSIAMYLPALLVLRISPVRALRFD